MRTTWIWLALAVVGCASTPHLDVREAPTLRPFGVRPPKAPTAAPPAAFRAEIHRTAAHAVPDLKSHLVAISLRSGSAYELPLHRAASQIA